MANPAHLKILKQGVKAWNEWRSEEPATTPNLVGANLRTIRLSGADLSRAWLNQVDLTESDLSAADLGGADLADADMTNSDLRAANLRGANLTGTLLAYADLRWTNFDATELTGTNFHEAVMAETKFANTDLSVAVGLETVIHLSPSTIGTDTLYRSGGDIPDKFLRGAGLPDEFISYTQSLLISPIDFYSCFISYSAKDQQFADRLYTDLQSRGVRCWFAPHDVQGGKKLHEQIDWAIHFHDRTLLILSQDSINSSWVKTEISKARRREVQEKRHILFPIRLLDFEVLQKWECFDADMGTDSAKEIREYFIPDFSNWRDSHSYQQALHRLLQDLRGHRTRAAANLT